MVFFTKCMKSLCTPHKEAWYMFFQSIKRILIKNRPQKVREGGGRKAARKKLWKNKFLFEKYVVEDIITYMFKTVFKIVLLQKEIIYQKLLKTI